MPPLDTIFYDGQCGMCRRSTRCITKLDWLNRLDFEDFTTLPEDDLPVSLDIALQSMTMRTGDNRILVGLPAVRRALRHTPLGFLPALLLYLPGISHLAARSYRFIAHHRKRDTCPMP